MTAIYLVFKVYTSCYLTSEFFCGAFSTEEKAKAYIEKHRNAEDYYYEECPLDEEE